MPRKRKAARRYRNPEMILLQWQREVLQHGTIILNGPSREQWQAWATSPAAAKAWKQHRRELLAEWRERQADGRVQPNELPYGVYRFEQGMSDAEYWRGSEERYQQRHAAYERKQAEAAEQRKRAREEKINAERTTIN